jgi:hypothetical protein
LEDARVQEPKLLKKTERLPAGFEPLPESGKGLLLSD